MTLPPLASVGDLAAWVGSSIADDDPRAGAVLSAASALVRAYAGVTWTDTAGALADVPDVVSSVTVQVAARVWANPNGVVAASLDDGTLRWAEANAAGLFLTEADKAILGAFQTGSIGIGTLGITRGDVGTDTVYVPTAPAPAGYPFPWYSAQDLP